MKRFSGIFVKNPSVLALTKCPLLQKVDAIVSTYNMGRCWHLICHTEKSHCPHRLEDEGEQKREYENRLFSVQERNRREGRCGCAYN